MLKCKNPECKGFLKQELVIKDMRAVCPMCRMNSYVAHWGIPKVSQFEMVKWGKPRWHEVKDERVIKEMVEGGMRVL